MGKAHVADDSLPEVAADPVRAGDTSALLDIAEQLSDATVTTDTLAGALHRACILTGDAGGELWVRSGRTFERACAWFAHHECAEAVARTTVPTDVRLGAGVFGPAKARPAVRVAEPPAETAQIVERFGLHQHASIALRVGSEFVGIARFFAWRGEREASPEAPTMRRLESLLARGLARFLHESQQIEADRSFAMHAEVLSHATEGVALSDEKGRVLYVNEAMARLLGSTPDGLIGSYLSSLYEGTSVGNVARYEEIWRALQTAGEWRGEIPLHRKHDAPSLTAVHATAFTFDGVPYALALHTDTSEGSAKQGELETARQRLEHLLTANPAIIYTRSAVGVKGLTFISDDVRTRFGYEPADFLRVHDFWARHVHPEDASRVTTEIEHAAAGAKQSIEYRFRHSDGRYRWIHDQYKLVHLDGATEIIGCWVDISELKHTEFMLERQTRRLAKSNRELEQFAYVASHDLRAPLRALDTLSEWLENDLDPVLTPESRQQMKLLRGRVKRMDRLLAELLEYSRIGRINLNIEEVDTAELIREIVDLSQLDQVLEVHLEEPMPRLVTARLPLKRVFMNLLTNAAKHHDRPHGTVRVRCTDCGDHYTFEVADDGPGIPPQYHERVFQMFQTLKARDASEGTGMGLALVRRIVESAGGRVTLISDRQRGATFQFTWPRMWQEAATNTAIPATPAPQEGGKLS